MFERADRIGGLLRDGLPEFKMEKHFLDRRLAILKQEGIVFRPNTDIGGNMPVEDVRRAFHALVLAGGATQARDLQVPGRDLQGIHLAVEYLTQQNRICEGDVVPAEQLISAAGKRVVIIGGGDTGADRLGTAHRQGAFSVHQFELLPRPPEEPERNGLLSNLGVRLTERGNVWRDANWMTSVPGVFTAGDMQRGQSLIVWAIAEGRSAARALTRFS